MFFFLWVKECHLFRPRKPSALKVPQQHCLKGTSHPGDPRMVDMFRKISSWKMVDSHLIFPKHHYLVAGFNICFNHLEKYESVGSIIPIYYGKITNVPNHQPVIR